LRVVFLTAAALIGFAANSLLTRGALGAGRLDAATFTCIRLLTGALTLAVLARVRRSGPVVERGSWLSAAELAGYAVFFTLAYTRIGAGVGALILFGSVQVTMIGTGLVRGERPGLVDWLGFGLAIAGLMTFTLPGASAPDPIGFALMMAAGACWGAYSLAGRRSRDPLGATAGNFLRASLAGLIFAAVAFNMWHVTGTGVGLAAASGSLASGVGYTLWYAALPSLAAWRAAVLQLVVPLLTAIAAKTMLGEALSTQLIVAGLLIAAGVGLTITPAFHRR